MRDPSRMAARGKTGSPGRRAEKFRIEAATRIYNAEIYGVFRNCVEEGRRTLNGGRVVEGGGWHLESLPRREDTGRKLGTR